jgi:hypothetical protein
MVTENTGILRFATPPNIIFILGSHFFLVYHFIPGSKYLTL